MAWHSSTSIYLASLFISIYKSDETGGPKKQAARAVPACLFSAAEPERTRRRPQFWPPAAVCMHLLCAVRVRGCACASSVHVVFVALCELPMPGTGRQAPHFPSPAARQKLKKWWTTGRRGRTRRVAGQAATDSLAPPPVCPPAMLYAGSMTKFSPIIINY